MSAPKMQHCFNCGEELGIYAAYYGDLQTCTKKECNDEARDQYRYEQMDRKERAREDNYERY